MNTATGDEQRWNAVRSLLAAQSAEPPIVPVVRDGPLPASFAQERFWFLDRWAPGNPAYNLGVLLRLAGPLDVDALTRSLGDLGRRHEILRTSFAFADGLVQNIAPPAPVELVAEAVAAEALERWAAPFAAAPFDLGRGPLFRCALARLASDQHALVLAQHHAIFDAWSFEILMDELTSLYEAYRAGRSAPLAPGGLQYADYSAWERRRLNGPVRARLLAYWTARLAGQLPCLELPRDRTRPLGPNRRGGSHTITLAAELTAALKRLGRAEGASLNVVLLAAWKTLLHRLTGEEDVIVGVPVAQRNRRELAGMLGMLTGTVAVRTDLGGEPTFRRLLTRVNESVTGALAHAELPFDVVVRALPGRRSGDAPLFRVMFAFQNVPRRNWRWAGLDVSARNLPAAGAKCDLALTMQETAAGLSALFEYDADLFEPATAVGWADQFSTLLAAIAAEPEQPIARLQTLSAAARARALGSASGDDVGLPAPSVHRAFEATVARAPEATALVAGDAVLSYGAINRRANQLAHHLRRRGLGAGAVIGICLDRQVALVVAELGILKAGAAYLPLAPATPTARLRQLFEGVAAVVTRAGTLTAPVAVPVIDVDVAAQDTDVHDVHDCGDDGGPEDLAYVMFTSGSTGAPRGVAIPHRGILRLVAGDYARLGPEEVLLQLAPAGFDASTFEIWGALLHGAKLVVPPAGRLSISEIKDLIERHRVTTLWLTSGLFERLVDAGVGELTSLRQLLTGGDVMSAAHAERFLRALPGCRLVNCYGPTENTTFTTTHTVAAVEPDRPIPIGRPIPGTRLYVLDGQREPVPPGVVGEAYVAGAGVAQGYWNDEAATASRFRPSPFVRGETIYRTGDLVRQRGDGAFEFVARRDRQIKIRGFRVEPAEVEATLAACPAVARAVVAVDASGPGEKRLIAHVVARTAGVDAAELRAYLRARLPDYLVPAGVVFVSDLPLTENGKRGSPAAVLAPLRAVVDARDDWERQVKLLFQATLANREVGIHDNFFDVGGDSLTALELGVAIERATGRPFPLATLYENPTIALLACALGGTAPATASDGVVLLKSGQATRPLFLVPGGHGGAVELATFAQLARRLDVPCSVWGLPKVSAATTMQELARAHLTAIRRVQPRGPYRLGGECIGGLVAYEIAQELVAGGEVVELLLLLDTWCPTDAGVLYHALVGQPVALAKAGLRFVATRPKRANHRWLRELWRRAVVPPAAKRYIRACMRYRPRPYPGGLTLVASGANLDRGIASLWQALARGGLRVHRARGDHETYLREHLDSTGDLVAMALAETLDSVRAKGGA